MTSSNSSLTDISLSLRSVESLRDHVSASLRQVIIEHLWGHRQPSQLAQLEDLRKLDAFLDIYFRYYSQQCDLIGRHANGKYSSVETHQDVMDIAELLQKPLARQEVRLRMSDFLKSADEWQHDNSINLVARLLLMTKFGNVSHECLGGRPIEWVDGSLPEFVHSYFSRPSVRGYDRIKLEKPFNALNLQRIAGIKIWWTDNLADHLRMRDDDKAVEIFCHASFLEYQLDRYFSLGHETIKIKTNGKYIGTAPCSHLLSSKRLCKQSRFYSPSTTLQPKNGSKRLPRIHQGVLILKF